MRSVDKRVLVTGIKGFTGRYMADELATQGYRVFGIGIGNRVGPDYFEADLLDALRLKSVLREVQPDIVVHLAALAFVGHGNANDFYKVNVIGTRNLLEAVAASGKCPSCILLASSANIYGNASEGELREDTLPAPANDYAVSKLAMEYMASLWKERLPLIIARPFNYTGVGQTENFLLPKIVDHFRRRASVIELGNLNVSRDFNDVRTVVNLYRRLLERPEALGQTVNISSGATWSLGNVVALCERLTGHVIRIEVNPAFVRSNEVRVLCGNNSRLRGLVGDLNGKPLEETLTWMLAA